MNNELKREFYKLFDNGCTDYDNLFESKEDAKKTQSYLCYVYFNKLSSLEKLDIINEIDDSYLNRFYKCINHALADDTSDSYFTTGITFIHGLVARLNNTLVDLFNEALEEYNINNIEYRDRGQRQQLTEFEENWLGDYNDRRY